MSKQTNFIHLGLKDYKEAWDYQEEIFKRTVNQKINNRKIAVEDQTETTNHLIFCYHPHVFTLGKSGDENHLLGNETFLKEKRASFYKINRGGDITYHGPGQIVGYPILDLDHFFTDIHKYLRFLEEAAEEYIFGINWEGDIRFDIACINMKSEIEIFEDAF